MPTRMLQTTGKARLRTRGTKRTTGILQVIAAFRKMAVRVQTPATFSKTGPIPAITNMRGRGPIPRKTRGQQVHHRQAISRRTGPRQEVRQRLGQQRTHSSLLHDPPSSPRIGHRLRAVAHSTAPAIPSPIARRANEDKPVWEGRRRDRHNPGPLPAPGRGEL